MAKDLARTDALAGLDERHTAASTAASRLVNWTWDTSYSGWDNRIGYERWFTDPEMEYDPFTSLGPIDALAIINQHEGALEWALYESGGNLYGLMDYASVPAQQTLASGLGIPAPGEHPALFSPYGRFVFRSGPGGVHKLDLWPLQPNLGFSPLYPFGWSAPPPAPRAWGVDNSPSTMAGYGEEVGIWASRTGDTAVPFDLKEAGLGSTTPEATNTYKWKVAFVSNTGSESPLSGESNTVTWETPAAIVTYWNGRRYIVYLEIPVGPKGTIARRLYRTRNLGDGETVPETYYYEKDIPNNTDTGTFCSLSDNELGSEAPGVADSTVIGAAPRFLAVFKGCVFIDGGASAATVLRWSKQGQPESFRALDYVDIGQRRGGAITGLVTHTNFLLVLRESGIDMVRGDAASGFQVVPLSEEIGSRASHGACPVPGLGMLFLADDGVYAIGGSFDAGGSVRIEKLSDPIGKTMARLNVSAMSKAQAAYSAKWREWHCYFPADGSDRNSLGIVLHLDHPAGLAWSVREGFPVGALAVTSGGDFVFGHKDGREGQATPVPAGLFVVSKRRISGGTWVAGGEQEADTVIDNDPLTSVYRSAWLDSNNEPMKKHAREVYVNALTLAGASVTMNACKDWETTASSDSQTVVFQRADYAPQPVYDTSFYDAAGTLWQEAYPSTLRFDIAPMAASWIAWEISTTVSAVLMSYTVHGSAPGKRVIGAGT